VGCTNDKQTYQTISQPIPAIIRQLLPIKQIINQSFNQMAIEHVGIDKDKRLALSLYMTHIAHNGTTKRSR
jgi:hypothetical protein